MSTAKTGKAQISQKRASNLTAKGRKQYGVTPKQQASAKKAQSKKKLTSKKRAGKSRTK